MKNSTNIQTTNRESAPKAILFDWDNTLVDTWPTIQDAMNHTLVHFNMDPWSMAETRKRVRKSMRDSFPDLFGEAWHDAADVFYGRYRDIHINQLRPLPGAEDMLKQLHAKSIYMSVVSNKLGDYLRAEVKYLEWGSYLDNLIGAGDAAHDKPASDPVHLALAGSELIPDSSIWFVGDANIDLQCGTLAGCTPILLREEAPSVGEFDDYPPQHHMKNCSEFKDLLSTLLA